MSDKAIKSAYKLLQSSILRYQGKPVGTAAAVNTPMEAANYEECFVRDFVPSALVFLMDGETEIVKNFLEVIVDLRSQEEYEKEHIIGAINIPAYKDPNTSAYGDVERIVNSFSELDQSKDIIVYCYSGPCMTGRKVGKMLVDNGIYVKHLGIGGNEWRYHWDLWNHEHEWDVTDVEDYIYSGPEPGVIEGADATEVCDIKNEFGC